jgi:hypothetical protein
VPVVGSKLLPKPVTLRTGHNLEIKPDVTVSSGPPPPAKKPHRTKVTDSRDGRA